jgi:1,4-alpha-glucan branching enzyme
MNGKNQLHINNVSFPLLSEIPHSQNISCSPHSSHGNPPQSDSAAIQQTVASEVVYSAIQSHNLLIHENKIRKKYKLLLLTWEFPPSVYGGLGKHVWELSASLAAQGHEITVVTPNSPGAPSFEKMEGMEIIRVKEAAPLYLDFHLYIGKVNMDMVERVLEGSNQDWDLIHAHDWSAGYAARALKRQLSIPLITSIHALESGRNSLLTENQQRTHDLEKALAEQSDEIIVCSNYMKQKVQSLTTEDKNISVIPNGVKLAEPNNSSIHEFLKRYRYTHLILTMGRMVPEKGFLTFLEAAQLLLKQYPDALFALAGKGPLLQEYRELSHKMGLGKSALFVGFLNESEKATMLSLCDIFVVPSIYEPFGITALEGMYAEKPVIASRAGGLATIITDSETGLFFSAGDKNSLLEKLELLMENPSLRDELGKKAKKEVVEKYNWEDVRELTEAVYHTSLTTSSVQ